MASHFKEVQKKMFSLVFLLSLTSIANIPAKAGIQFTGDVESLIETVIEGASKTMGKAAGAGPVKWDWCDGTYYNSRSKLICLEPKFIKQLSQIGESAVAIVVAHEYAHHVQFAKSKLIAKAKGNTMRMELQADWFAGVILASAKNISFDESDIKDMIIAASLLGDQEYDSQQHHGPGENRALALRSGLRFGASKGKNKDAYYNMFCRQN